MEFLAHLWLPIVVSAVLVFVASSVIHMVVQWHKPEFHGFSNEDAVRAAINTGNAAPGQYIVPYCSDMKEIKTEPMQKKFQEGPIAYITLRTPGTPHMGGALGAWFALNVAIAVISAYLAAKTLPAGATAGQVCRVAGTLTFLAYGAGSIQMGIWMGKPWSSVAKDQLDAVIYAAITAGTFAFFWR
jgi:hypothetical protein